MKNISLKIDNINFYAFLFIPSLLMCLAYIPLLFSVSDIFSWLALFLLLILFFVLVVSSFIYRKKKILNHKLQTKNDYKLFALLSLFFLPFLSTAYVASYGHGCFFGFSGFAIQISNFIFLFLSLFFLFSILGLFFIRSEKITAYIKYSLLSFSLIFLSVISYELIDKLFLNGSVCF